MTTPNEPQNLNVNPLTSANAAPLILNNPAPQGQYFTAEDLERARQQEKEKLYGRLQKQEDTINNFQSQLQELQAERVKREEAETKAALAAEEARKKEEESRLSAEELIRAKETELRQQLQRSQEEMELKFATLKLQSFTQRRVAEEIAANSIIPDLVEYIGGNNEDEVELSITKAKEKTANIVKGAMTLSAPQTPSGVSPTGGPSGPLDTIGGPKQYTKADIEGMSMDEFREFRKQQGIAAAGNNRGMFS